MGAQQAKESSKREHAQTDNVSMEIAGSQEEVAFKRNCTCPRQAADIPIDVDVYIVNKHSVRKLYAAECANWEHKLGAGSPASAVDADGVWCITNDSDGFRLVNKYSHRCLYARQGENWEGGVGAGSPPSSVHADGVWYITPEEDGFRIVNKHSERCLYAADGKNWEKKVGAGYPHSAVHADGIWYISEAQMPAALPHRRSAADNIKSLKEVHFPMMTDNDSAQFTLNFDDSSDFAGSVRQILDDHGLAIVTGVVSEQECLELEQIWTCEQHEQTPQPHEHAQGELAWTARLHPNAKAVFASIFGVDRDDLSVGMDKVFFTPDGASAAEVNHQWLHVDQNHHTGLKHLCYQGVLYIRPSGQASSTTAIWPGSHRDEVYQQRVLAAPGSNTGRQFLPLNDLKDFDLRCQAVALSRRIPVPAGALLLWDSRAVHQGWHGGPRLAVPICWEPRERVDSQTKQRKLFYSAVGAPTSHSPSEGRLHPSCRELHELTPSIRPYSVLPVEQLSDDEWSSLWNQGKPSADSLARMLRPEIAEAL